MEDRGISLQDLRRLQDWVNSGPGAPEGIAHRKEGWFAMPASFLASFRDILHAGAREGVQKDLAVQRGTNE